jgi:hypothetical protein
MSAAINPKKSLTIIRDLIIAEILAYASFMAVALASDWAELYNGFLVSHYVSFTVLEFVSLGIIQIALIIFVVTRSLREDISIHELIQTGEHEQLEFKTSMRWDAKRGQINRELERSVMKTIAAFMNSKGGSLVIGVDDKQGIVGLRPDLNSLNKKDHDGFENHFNNVFNAMLGPEFRRHVQLSFHEIGREHVCLVSVEQANQPVYLKTDTGEDFFIRTGNATTPLKVSQVASYISAWRQR